MKNIFIFLITFTFCFTLAGQESSPRRGTKMKLSFETDKSMNVTNLQKPVEILAWSWGVSNISEDSESKQSRDLKVQDMSFTKFVGPESAEIIKLLSQKTKISKVVLEVENAMTIKFTMNKVLITSVASGGSGGEERLTENFTLQFDNVDLQYTEGANVGKASVKNNSGN